MGTWSFRWADKQLSDWNGSHLGQSQTWAILIGPYYTANPLQLASAPHSLPLCSVLDIPLRCPHTSSSAISGLLPIFWRGWRSSLETEGGSYWGSRGLLHISSPWDICSKLGCGCSSWEAEDSDNALEDAIFSEVTSSTLKRTMTWERDKHYSESRAHFRVRSERATGETTGNDGSGHSPMSLWFRGAAVGEMAEVLIARDSLWPIDGTREI